VGYITLQTDTDREIEERIIARLSDHYPGSEFHRFPEFSVCDYIRTDDGVSEFVEIKARKEPHFSVRKYGGLWLKKYKAEDLTRLSELTNTPVRVVFAFRNGDGAVYSCDPTTLSDRKAVLPKERRNYRGIAADDDLVYLLDWDTDLTVMMQPVDSG
jgi:hypothetical protein